MSDLTAFRDHARKMAEAEHKPECRGTIEDRWGSSRVWPNPECSGCNSAEDREWFRRLADEVDAYLAAPAVVEDLFGDAAVEPWEAPGGIAQEPEGRIMGVEHGPWPTLGGGS